LQRQVLYTDNLHKDSSGFESVCNAIERLRRADGSLQRPAHPTKVLQDLWHARERVTRTLAKDHPDYKAAVGEWNATMHVCVCYTVLVGCKGSIAQHIAQNF
jgi:hypothetical protein